MSFDNTTWATPQTLTITAPEDYSVDGDQTTTISYTIASTNPTDTLHGASGNFNVVTADSGATAVTVANSSPSVTEGTTNNSTTFALSGPPNGTVTVTITSSDTGEATVSPTTMTFDNTTWNVPQTITLSGVEDYFIDGNQSSTISYTLSSTDTTEPFHNAFGSFSASIIDSGTRLFVVSDDSPTVNEGYSSTITFALDSAPAGTVTVALSSADDNETTVSPTTLTFNSGNYNVAQTITLYGTEDYIIDGNQQTVVSLAVTSTNTGDVVHNVNTSITATTVDSGLGTAFSLSTATPSVTEGTTDNSTTFVLLSPPKGTVTVTFSSADDNETVVSPNTLTFTPANWNVPQALPLVGVEDFIADGNQTTAMNVSFSSTDSTDGVHGETASFNVITNDSGITGTFTLSPSTPSVAEGNSDNSSTFVLTSAPNGTVTVTLSSDNSSELGVSPTNLVFTPANWNVPQNFTVTGVEDFNVDGTQPTNINISYSSSDTTDGIHGQSSSFAVNVTDSGKGATTITSAVAGEQKVTLNWSGPAGMSSYTIYYTSDGSTPTTSSDNITVSDGTATSYVLGGLTGGLNYNFSIIANLGADSSNLVGPVAATPSVLSCSPSYTPDTDSDLLVYYDFDDTSGEGLHDKSPANGRTSSASAWPYDLTNTGGTLRFPQGCTNGMAGYFDSSSGYVENNNLNDTSTGNRFVNGNFTITMWFYAESDMVNHSGLMASKQVAGTGNDGGNWSWQLDSTGSANLRWRSSHGANYTNASRYTHTETSSTYSKNQWTHAAFVKNDNGTSQIYLNGVLEATSSETQNTPMNKLFIGVNRALANSWKGYIDEVKVYGRAFTADNVTNACLLYQECEKYVKPATPTGLTATNPGSGTSINLTWNTVTGADNYTVYWTDDPSTPIDPSNPATYDNSTTVTGASTSATGLTANTSYDFTIIATNAAGSSSPATEVNATPTLVLPAAIDNVTAYHGFYGDAKIYTATDPDRYYIFPPSYAITWNAHPDFVYSANGDYYKVFISDNLSQPIDPTDSSTYISQQWATTNKTVIQTRPFITIDGVTHNDGFLENKPIRIAVVFEDDSKGDILSPVTEVTPTMASEAYRQWGDLRIHGGFFAAGDNSTLYGFGRSNGGDPIRIEHKDMVNVGERAIFDGAWLKSDVFPLMGNSAGNDFMFLTWYQPEKPAFNHNFSTGGTYFKRSRTSNWRLESSTISPNSICGASDAEDCDFAMELQAEDTVGLIIQNSDGRQYKGSGIGYTNTGSGTLNGPTDYAANDYTTWSAGNGRYTKEHTGSSHWLDNSSYAGMTLSSTKNIVQINLANADAAISKVAIPIPPPDNLSVSASGSNMSLSWDNSTALTNTYSIYRSADNSTWSLVTTLSGYDNNTYTDSSLSNGTYYYKIGANGTYYTSDNSTVASGVIATASPAFKYSITGNDNDVSEDGSSDTTSLNLYLDAAPNGNVVVDITVSDATELAIGSTQLTFTPANYGNTQNWSVTGVDDALDDGNVVSQVTIAINGAGTTDTTGYASLSSKNKSITTLDDDAAPVLNSVTAGTQLNTLSWNAYSGATAYRIYWSTSSPVTTSSNVIDNISNSATSYQHSGRTAGTTYYYAFVANTSVGFSSLSNELNATPTAIAGCTSSGAVADNDPDLLVHYAFEGNLEDIEDTNSDNRYDLTNSSGTMQYAQS
ncbi:MAG: sialidase domain-containing protein [SAR324 cluster bacterium]|nr:sialidase domain-containing protein [SAR324 cluster bacterium]